MTTDPSKKLKSPQLLTTLIASRISRSLVVLIAAGSITFFSAAACDSKSSSSSGSNAGGSSEASDASRDDDASDEDAADAGATGPVFGTATITGTIVLEGEAPSEKKIPMQGDRFCVQHNKKHADPKLEIGENGGLPHVFVYIKKGISAKYPPPEEVVVLDQSGCMYEPHVFGIQVGQTLRIKNSDDTAHNVHSMAKKNQKFNIAQAQKGSVAEKTFTREEVMMKFKCDVHGWMSSFAGVVKHPFFAVTDADGHFKIEKLPAGKYTIETSHELYGTRTIEIEVADGESKEADVTYKKRG